MRSRFFWQQIPHEDQGKDQQKKFVQKFIELEYNISYGNKQKLNTMG